MIRLHGTASPRRSSPRGAAERDPTAVRDSGARPIRSLTRAILLALPLAACARPAARASVDGAAARPRGAPGPGDAWSAPDSVAGIPLGVSLDWPSLSMRGDTAYLAGNLMPVDITTRVAPRPIFIRRIPGGVVRAPDGPRQFAFPRGVIDATGRYHLLWAESSEPDSDPTRWPGGPLTSLWYAVLDRGTWSTPSEILHARSIHWSYDQGVVALDAAGRLHVAVPAVRERGVPTLLYLRKTGTELETRSFDFPIAYASIAAHGRDSLAIAYVGPDRTTPRDHGSLVVWVSSDGGASWHAAGPIERSGGGPPRRPLVLYGESGALHVLWQDRTVGFEGGDLQHAWSRDGGGHWTILPAAAVNGSIRYHASVDRCGTLTAISERLDGERVLLDEIHWPRRGPPVQRPFPGYLVAANAALADNGQITRLLWSAVRSPGDTATLLTAVRRSCPRG